VTYPNLEAEMKRSGITGAEIAQCIGVGRGTFSSWMRGADAAFPIIKAKRVRDEFFVGQSLDYLFSETPTMPTI
jgi:transcriptional regulator with XRE-family HTH domain